MTERQLRSHLRAWHRWLGALLALFVVLAGVTGFLLQHPRWLGAPALTVTAVAADPDDPRRVLRGTNWGVEVSTDGGLSWREAPMLQPPASVRRIAFAPGGSDTVYVLGESTLLRSEDGGHVWELVTLPRTAAGAPLRPHDLAPGRDGGLDLLAEDGLWRRAPDGTWQHVHPEGARAAGDVHRFLRDLHTGRLFGDAGRLVADATAAGLLILTVTGVVLLARGRRSRA